MWRRAKQQRRRGGGTLVVVLLLSVPLFTFYYFFIILNLKISHTYRVPWILENPVQVPYFALWIRLCRKANPAPWCFRCSRDPMRLQVAEPGGFFRCSRDPMRLQVAEPCGISGVQDTLWGSRWQSMVFQVFITVSSCAPWLNKWAGPPLAPPPDPPPLQTEERKRNGKWHRVTV